MEQPTGFTFNDDITEEQDQQQPPEVDPMAVDWSDTEDVLSLAEYIQSQLFRILHQLVDEVSTKCLDGTANAQLVSALAMSEAMHDLFSRYTIPLAALIDPKDADWMPNLFGYEDWESLRADLTDYANLRDAVAKCRATGESCSVDMEDDDVQFVVEANENGRPEIHVMV